MLPELDNIHVERINERASENKANKRAVNVDMNPMVDLAFLLLTFFMLATTFSKPQAMELLIPAKPNEQDIEKEMPVKESQTLSLLMLNNEVIWYKGISDPETYRIPYSQLEALLSAQNAATKDMVVLIKAAQSSTYENLVLTLDALNYSGVKRYAISDVTDFDLTLSTESTPGHVE
jgi:biopolymer transport protein ExbD